MYYVKKKYNDNLWSPFQQRFDIYSLAAAIADYCLTTEKYVQFLLALPQAFSI